MCRTCACARNVCTLFSFLCNSTSAFDRSNYFTMLQILISGTTKECGKLFPLGLWNRLQSHVLMAQTHSLLPQDHLHGFIASWWKNEHPWVSSPGLSPIRGDDLTIDQDALVLLSFPLLKALGNFPFWLFWIDWHGLLCQRSNKLYDGGWFRLKTACSAIKQSQFLSTRVSKVTLIQHSWKMN